MTLSSTFQANPPRNEGGASQAFAPIASRLESLGSQFRLAHVVGGLARFVALVVPLLLLVLLIVGAIDLPRWMQLTLLLATAGGVAYAYVRLLHAALFQRPTYGQIARWIETRAQEMGRPLSNELINAVLLAQENASTRQTSTHDGPRSGKSSDGSSWVPAVILEIERALEQVDLRPMVPWKKQWHTWLWGLGVLVLVGAIGATFWPTLAHGMRVLGNPGEFVPHVGKVKIVAVEPGNDSVLVGQPVTFIGTIEAADNKPVEGKITIQFASGKLIVYPLSAFGSDNTRYYYKLPAVAENLNYFLTLGDSESKRFHLDVIPEIHLVGYQLTVSPPAYTHRPPQTVRIAGKELNAAKGSLEVPQGSTVELAVALDMPVKEMLLEIAGGTPQALQASSDGRTFTYTLPLRDSVRYALRVNDASQRTLRRYPDESAAASPDGTTIGAGSAYFTLAATPDNPPAIAVTEPGRDLDARPGDTVLLAASATDDYGLTQVRLEAARGTEGAFSEIKRWDIPAGPNGKSPPLLPRQFTAKFAWELAAKDYKFGDTVRYRFVATDNRDLMTLSSDLGAQTTTGTVYSISFNDTSAAAAKSMAAWELLRQKLQGFLDRQIALRKVSQTLQDQMALDEVRKLAQSQGDGQKNLLTEMTLLTKEFPFEPGMKLIQKSLQVIVTEDAANAVARCADLNALGDTRALNPLATRLRQHQTRIIDALQALLAIATAAEKKATPTVDKEGTNMPNESKQAWQKLADDLKKFEKEQKKVIEATTDLAKKPKDQYDQDDLQKLRDAAAVEDKWEKFLAQKIADLSKLAEQDQANVSLLEEMVQMKVELAMAKDALQQKATEIATPLEENGLENAKALDTHIERWLMQQPDTTKWSMEELPTQNEVPAAELPKQLQDMVGDLLQNEEDLTSEMESQASKALDSMNKGAGWDAGDGPMSNNSAQGVTGNTMPKDMEIQGKSGEGREGRASGEMVGADAEGKGGRRTPTRMTTDPFASGKVNDKSKDPAGGATGGGKKAGWGDVGLQGDAPDTPKDPMQRLAGKQSALHNEAERLEIQSRKTGFVNIKLMEAAVYMQRAEEALKAGKYHNALYFQQQAVKNLSTAKVLAAGEMHVTMDTSPTMSTKTQKDIQDALNGVMPKGFADPVKAYFTRLSTEPNE